MKVRILHTNAGRDGLDCRFVLNCKEIERFLVAMQKKISIRGAFAGLLRSLACNYRPVSLTCVLCKLLEHIVCSNIMAHLAEHKLLSDKQHAFRKWHSCETQIATVINDWAKMLDNKGQTDTFILDFEKAFDTSPHELLKSKLFSYGIGGKTLNWINAFVCYRQQQFVVNGVKSD